VKIDIQNYILVTQLQIQLVKIGQQISSLWDSTQSIKHKVDGEVMWRSRSGVSRLPHHQLMGEFKCSTAVAIFNQWWAAVAKSS